MNYNKEHDTNATIRKPSDTEHSNNISDTQICDIPENICDIPENLTFDNISNITCDTRSPVLSRNFLTDILDLQNISDMLIENITIPSPTKDTEERNVQLHNSQLDHTYATKNNNTRVIS